VISTAGVSSYELCCLGLPLGLVEAVDNQRDNYRALTSADAATGLGTATDVAHDPATVTARLRAWFEDADRRVRQAAIARGLVDGLGADRIVEAIASRLEVSRG
jgi:spore coat polysaccharide biosynthesis predicted glycosyltransferase SpsG